MKKKLLAGILTLALCSTNILPQTVFAEEFTSGNPEEVSEEETPEVFTDENQESAGETEEELSVFSEGTSEFEDNNNETNKPNEGSTITDVDLTSDSAIINSVYIITSGDTAYRFTSNGKETSNRIKLSDTINAAKPICIYLKNVNIKTSEGPALLIPENLNAEVHIYLEGENVLETSNHDSAALQKENTSKLIIDNVPNSAGSLAATAMDTYVSTETGGTWILAWGAGIGGGAKQKGSNITINGGIITASSNIGAGIGGGNGGNGESIIINGGSVSAKSSIGAGIGGGGYQGNGEYITINGGTITAKAGIGAGIGGGQQCRGFKITIENGFVTADSAFGAGIGGGGNGYGSDITINKGTITADSSSGAGIGGGYLKNGNNIIISNSLVSADSLFGDAIGGGSESSSPSSNITISGGSVKAAKLGCQPKNDSNKDVYRCTIENPEKAKVTIRPKIDGEERQWNPVNHSSLDPNDTNLYVWLPKLENDSENNYYMITLQPEINSEHRRRNYSFDTDTKTFKTWQAVNDFDFKSPENTTYDGKPKEASLEFKFKPTSENNRTISLNYYEGNYNDINDSTQPLNTLPVNAGTYTVKAKIAASESYFAHNGLESPEWTFTIEKAPVAPGADFNKTTIFVPWSSKRISDITRPFSTDWKWDTDVDQELQVETPIKATAIYKGADKGNYEKETITYTIIRNECEHKNTVGRYYSSPSCTSNGYSGDTYCNDCERTIYYGSTIPAYGHDYDAGVIITEPTAETDGIVIYTCKRCKHQDTKNIGKLGDGEPYIEGSFQKKGWDAVNNLIRTSKEKDTISITLNGARTLPASVLSGIKGKDISLNLDMENGFIWKINGASITSETPADTDLFVTNTAEYIPEALYRLVSTNQNDFGFHLGRNGDFDFPAVLSVKADASCAGLMANLFWYDVENKVLQCIQTVTVSGAFERSIPYADFTLSKGQDYFIAFGTESLNGRVIHTDGSITDENGAYLRPANAKISSHSIDRNKLTVKLSKGCEGAQGYDFVISKKSDMLKTGKFSKTVSSTGKPQASFKYLSKGTWYVAARSWVLDAQGNKVYGSWTKVKKIKITVVTPQQPKIRDITVKGNTVTVTYTKCKNATGYEILLGTKYKTSAGEKYPVKKYVKRTEGKNTVTVTFTNVKKGTWYVTVRSWNKTSKDKSRVYSPYSTMKKFTVCFFRN
ncbi:hypothetical protein [Blautia wexlerae]|uniref:hypothetical protein n=1 Tax=Blautia wexlerae TaxID=418240 RepID=UPI001896DF08